MRRFLILLLHGLILFLLLTDLQSQNISNNLRSIDNNKAIAADTTERLMHRMIKEISLSSVNNLPSVSFGGEIREQMRFFDPVNFGDVPAGQSDHDIFLHQRYMMHADLRLNKTFRIFTQFNSNHTTGKNALTSTDVDQLSIMQAFLDIDFKVGQVYMGLRAGRQELSFGAERIIGTGDGPNVRQHFDGLKYSVKTNHAVGTFLLVNPVKTNYGVFDNTTNKNSRIYGTYWNFDLKKSNLLELYFLRNNLKEISVESDTVHENRNSFGVRLSNTGVNFYYDTEFTLQTGNYGFKNVSAFHLTSIIGYQWWDAPRSPRLQIKGSVYSGNKEAGGVKVNFFHPVSAKPPVHNMVPIGPANIILLAPEGGFTITEEITLSFRYFALWRYSVNDGLYTTRADHMTRIPDIGGVRKGAFVMNGFNSQIDYTFNSHFSFYISTGYFVAGEYIKNTGSGKNIRSVFITAWYRF